MGDRPAYHGTAYIDAETFGLLRRDSVQENLKGETLSNVQSEFYSPVPGRPDVVLPLRIKGQQVFSTAGRTTSIERDVTMDPVEIDPPTFVERRAAALGLAATDDPRHARTACATSCRIRTTRESASCRQRVSRKSTFGILGGFYDGSFDYPIPLLGSSTSTSTCGRRASRSLSSLPARSSQATTPIPLWQAVASIWEPMSSPWPSLRPRSTTRRAKRSRERTSSTCPPSSA
jgi:hypothetical protein